MAPWQDPEWLAEVDAWIRAHVEPSGPLEQTHVRVWATAIRVPTARGDLWFKASIPRHAHEARIVELLAARRPDLVPPLLAHDRERGWMLSPDGGTQLRALVAQERDVTRWLDVLPLYAELQVVATQDVDAFLAAGVPDCRLAALPRLYDDLAEALDDDRLRAERERVAQMCRDLAAFGIPETIQHDDLHDAQVFVRDGRYRILDWGDAVVSHPFMTLAVTLEGVIAWGVDDVEHSVDVTPYRDEYLRLFGDPEELAPAVDIALRLGWILRALSGLGEVGEEQATRGRVEMFLYGRTD